MPGPGCSSHKPRSASAHQHDVAALPAGALHYLTASRYCEACELVDKAWALFGETPPTVR